MRQREKERAHERDLDIYLQTVLPLGVSMVYWDDKYGFAASPKSKIVDIGLEYQTLWPLPPVKHFIIRA